MDSIWFPTASKRKSWPVVRPIVKMYVGLQLIKKKVILLFNNQFNLYTNHLEAQVQLPKVIGSCSRLLISRSLCHALGGISSLRLAI